jgi:hypothetical protein
MVALMRRGASIAIVVLLPALAGAGVVAPRLATTPADFVQPGTQPSPALDNFIPPQPSCAGCHGDFAATETEPHDGWVASTMGQSARDPIVRAAAAIANQDAAGSGESCIRCHAPVGWLAGRSSGGSFADLMPADRDGVTCHMCHRMLDPIARDGAPAEDAGILAALDGVIVDGVNARPGGTCRGNASITCTTDATCGADGPCEVAAGQGRFVVDPEDRRRGPFSILLAPHATIASAFHRASDACAPCHDVSTPTLSRDPAGGYVLNDLGVPHPTQKPEDMFPEQRTYSEWRASEFARAGVVFPDGRFGGALTAARPNQVPVGTCQDCHMPDAHAAGCTGATPRPDLPTHYFAGANNWVLAAVLAEFPIESGLTATSVERAHARVAEMMAAASDLDATQMGTTLRIRVTNQTGHKLPTGYPEGRRMWLNVRFFEGDTLLGEDGAFDPAASTLDVAHTTKIYEVQQLIGPGVAGAVGLPSGTPFHLVLNDTVAFDNRIPPRGFTNAAFAAVGAAPAGYTYPDGQYWDETDYALPPRATRAEIRLYHQTTTREYAEFLRDTAPDATGENAYARWEAAGRSAPAVLDDVRVELVPLCAPEAGFCCGRPAGTPCDDGDSCTAGDVCTDVVCGGAIAGAEGVRCELARLARPGPCAEALPKKMQRLATRRARNAGRALEKAARRPDAARAVLDKAAQALVVLRDRAERAVTKVRTRQRLTPACAATIGVLVDRTTTLLHALP